MELVQPGAGSGSLFDNSGQGRYSSFSLQPENLSALVSLSGENNAHLQQIEQELSVEIANISYTFYVSGTESRASAAETIIKKLYQDALDNEQISSKTIHLYIQQEKMNEADVSEGRDTGKAPLVIKTHKSRIQTRGLNQRLFVQGVRDNAVQFGIGPAGTGKTWLAVACALESLLKREVERLILTRPAVEAGEKLGFLPGDLSQKVDPYLRPLFDALYDMAGTETVDKLIGRNVIEVAPLAFMRGRSLNNACIILDESQNTTIEQMKMLLTRIGFGSKAIVTGDLSQTDLPKNVTSGLKHARDALEGIEKIGFSSFRSQDVIRHQVVQSIVEAYNAYKGKNDDPNSH